MNKIIDGTQISEDIFNSIKNDISKNVGINKIGLAFILVGEDSASKTYVNMKKRACARVGILSLDYELPANSREIEIIDLIHKLNSDPKVHGILVQQPFPLHIDTKRVVFEIDPKKDVDGFHPMNLGKMMVGDTDCFYPCTPLGIKNLIEKSNIELEKKHVVICGRSNIVGKPLATLLVQNQKGCNATVTITHRLTENLGFYTKQADILISAVGKPKFITEDMVKEGGVVIDVGMNRLNNKLVGDVDYDNVFPKVSKITPVPGGVGPMTIVSLLSNTYKSYFKSQIFLCDY